ncbi:hypothetical protein VM1G_11517 [Cytospora mali]|uniref:Uncharacterized protein n=1 Tax=Cytospora mali TaxID=578113 RepID=A0A194VTG1_CYTMA|nr:hypothetical protein VM1G_11517 [Valsa mali]
MGKLKSISYALDAVTRWLAYLELRATSQHTCSTVYCSLQDGGELGDADDFSCDDECTLIYYTNTHNYAASGWLFNYYYLVDQSSYNRGINRVSYQSERIPFLEHGNCNDCGDEHCFRQ